MKISANKVKIYPLNNKHPFHFPLGEKFSNRYLTRRELEVLQYILLGCTAKKIGRLLNLSSRTIEAYIDTLKLKLCCQYKAEIIETVIREKLIDIMKLEISLIIVRDKHNR